MQREGTVELVDFVGRAEDEAVDQHVGRGKASDLVVLGVALRELVLAKVEESGGRRNSAEARVHSAPRSRRASS